ncbi:MAG: tRNA uridine-5-carboxymethylaminomethyl(34) synthesis GTPase MnmE [Deltaproteobacteria bacterium]|nr:tRNA uridine-5-carboxymethylaminomethyl(34) synthesis GTPase MnmE [Deltaproteobacteria bacterium]
MDNSQFHHFGTIPDKERADDTIAAVATPFGRGGIGIIRLSGQRAKEIAEKIFRPVNASSNLISHRLYLGNIIDPSSGNMIDEVLLSYMKAPRSYTREDVIEINSHSGHILLSRIMQIIMKEGARLAGPGEFTFRAFLNGRIDLTQAEAIVDLINSGSEKGIELATRQIKGSLKEEIEILRQRAIDLIAHSEVAIDFPEEEDGILCREDTASRIEAELIGPIEKIIAAHSRRKIWIDGINSVIAGRVNVGKSSLLNRLLNEQRAIVTPIPGTTRDIIESLINIEGIPVRLIDTAGIRKIRSEVEKIGIDLAEKKLAEADLSLIVMDQSRPIHKDDIDIINRSKNSLQIIIINKIDLPPVLRENELIRLANGSPVVKISALTGEGMDKLNESIKDRVMQSDPEAVSPSFIPNLRHKRALSESLKHFQKAAYNSRNNSPQEIISIDLNSGLEILGEITGTTSNEDIYVKIFRDFCIGK